MAAHDDRDTALDAHREQVFRPLLRLFRAYATGEARWLVLGLATSVLAYGTVLVTPLVLGTTIDAVFRSESAYTLPLVPEAWLSDRQSGQFWLSAAIVVPGTQVRSSVCNLITAAAESEPLYNF